MKQPIPVRLDDGTTGLVHIREAPCGAGESCDPVDCGCLRIDRYRLDVEDSHGRRGRPADFWAAYGIVSIVPVDLVGGPGDELVVVRVPGRASPPSGHELKVWRLDGDTPRAIGPAEAQVAKRFGTTPIGCARWRGVLSVDDRQPKPRSIAMRTELGAAGCCTFFDEERPIIDEVRRPVQFQFEPSSGTYVVRRGQR